MMAPRRHQARVWLIKDQVLIVSTNGCWQPGTDNDIHSNAIGQSIPEPHTGRLILYLLPVTRKDKECGNQRHAQADENTGPGAKTPGSLVPDHLDGNTVDPAQDHTQKHAEEQHEDCQ